MSESNERLIDGLIEDLEPVRPLPPIRAAFAVVLAVWAAILGVVLWSQEYTPGAAFLGSDRVYLASFLGLALAAFGATLSSLASGRPGRASLETLGLSLAAVGLLAGGGVCAFELLQAEVHVAHGSPGADAMCFRKGVYLSLLPAGVMLSFLWRGWASRPWLAGLAGVLAAGGLGALVVHLSCDMLEPGHLLRGHMSVPFVLSALGAYPLAILARRFRN